MAFKNDKKHLKKHHSFISDISFNFPASPGSKERIEAIKKEEKQTIN